jgi:hypothetical protein
VEKIKELDTAALVAQAGIHQALSLTLIQTLSPIRTKAPYLLPCNTVAQDREACPGAQGYPLPSSLPNRG